MKSYLFIISATLILGLHFSGCDGAYGDYTFNSDTETTQNPGSESSDGIDTGTAAPPPTPTDDGDTASSAIDSSSTDSSSAEAINDTADTSTQPQDTTDTGTQLQDTTDTGTQLQDTTDTATQLQDTATQLQDTADTGTQLQDTADTNSQPTDTSDTQQPDTTDTAVDTSTQLPDTTDTGTQTTDTSDSECNDDSCESKKTNGESCGTDNTECQSGVCFEGICCDRQCDIPCYSCNARIDLKGTCSVVPEGMDPEDDCAEAEPFTCGETGNCDGEGACQFYDETTQCEAPYCTDQNQSSWSASYCDGSGNCDTASSIETSCTPYTCDESGQCAGGPCSDVNPCAAGYFCDSENTCRPKKVNGSICESNSECESNDCTLDDFYYDGSTSYCVPNSPQYCVNEGTWYEPGVSLCAPKGGTNFNECGADASWITHNCQIGADSGCIPTDWATVSGISGFEYCVEGASGAECMPITSCQPCESTYQIDDATRPNMTEVTSTYVSFEQYAGASLGYIYLCRDDCMAGDTPSDDYCASKSTTENTQYCLPLTTTDGATVGICIEKIEDGPCTDPIECLSGQCEERFVTVPHQGEVSIGYYCVPTS
ncbi:MAG: hypothetical protein JXX14_25530 [Deltaproteobacteria bacterium]|nr:hypothetical protein [Deltaproteobacteria bacterium]